MWSRICLPFRSTWVFYDVCCVLLFVCLSLSFLALTLSVNCRSLNLNILLESYAPLLIYINELIINRIKCTYKCILWLGFWEHQLLRSIYCSYNILEVVILLQNNQNLKHENCKNLSSVIFSLLKFHSFNCIYHHKRFDGDGRLSIVMFNLVNNNSNPFFG